ncbi:MBL fold metallo-hydrolase RNA specificity domain-containing protein [Kangiella sp. M94]
MKITFLGGTETVTGSKFLVETTTSRVLVDCGLFQGYKWLRERNWQEPLFDIKSLDAVILTHAHLDHSGYIPALYKQGYRGPVYTHHATKDLCAILLADSGHIQEEDAKYYSKHKLGKHAHPQPLYDRATAEESMTLFQSLEFGEIIVVGDLSFHLQSAGHILGAGSVILEAEGKRIGFSGDVGRPDDILTLPPKPLPDLDLLLLESTYGNRRHDTENPYKQLAKIVNEAAQRGGAVLIPSFAVGRAQTLQHMLTTLMKSGDIPKLPIYLDSPMAINVSDIYCHYSKLHRLTDEECHRMCQTTTYTRSVEDSKALAQQHYPHVIIAGSGMASGGRILHHFKRLLGDSKTTVLFSGYQAGGTRGAKMLDGAETVKIHGKWIPIKAKVEVLHHLSGHGDYVEIEQWLKSSALKKQLSIQLIHGDPEALESMRNYLQSETHFEVGVASYHRTLHV